ncbi:palmitoyl-protein thioesterase ABHD10, mitochondrial-like [Hetaerina americana]|uniref:palmitoyl-protein thioesterase ABHD10, mitochondrial-like n=1 Tax=Hetaerina americana TaxID=62018 RepID=UPI003A7F588D
MSRFCNVLGILTKPNYPLGKTSRTLRKRLLNPTNAFSFESGRNVSIESTPRFSLIKGNGPRNQVLGSPRNKELFILDKKYMSSVPTQYIDLDGGRKIAYKLTVGDLRKPTVVYVPGLLNTMEETKAVALHTFCEKTQLTLVRFDFEGIGESPGSIEKVNFGQWIDDLRHVVKEICQTPVIYVAFSMGGWISTKIAIEIPEKLHSILYVAPGFNFLQYYYGIFYEKLPPEQKKALDDGACIYFNDLFMRKDFATESVKHHINLKEKIPIAAPIRILHGMLDKDAPYKVSLDLLPMFESSDVDIYLRKSGKHFMTEPSDLAIMISLLDELVQKYPLKK